MAESSTSPRDRFVPLSTHHLSSQPPLSETTLPSLIEHSNLLAEEAREALPYSFDECTYSKGYLRQSVWSCIDCGEKGVCYGCSISCHADHKLVELWTRRHFKCDCPTVVMPKVEGKRRKCKLNPPEAQPREVNEENRYTVNYAGKFCRCGRDYDPETEKEAMLNCIGCEDWFHESCLNLIPSPALGEAAKLEQEDEDEEKEVLIPSETYDGLICAACVKSHPALRERAGREGWMMIARNTMGEWNIVGRPQVKAEEAPEVTAAAVKPDVKEEAKEEGKEEVQDHGDVRVEEDTVRDEIKTERGGLDISLKRSAEDVTDEGTDSKRAKTEPDTRQQALLGETSSYGDVFLAHGQREELRTELTTEVAASLPFPLEDEEIYEPPQDAEEDETLDEVTDRVVGSLPRVQAIEALHGYQMMKDKLRTMLAGHVQDGRAVSKEDIEGFFEQLQAGRTRN